MVGLDTSVLVHLEIKESPEHARAHDWLHRVILDGGETIALAPQVLTEFIHVVTDPKRFERPLSMQQALDKTRFWWNAAEVRRIYPTAESTSRFLDWLHQHSLGRKRLLDTHLAATFHIAGVRKIVTSNIRDFSIFGEFEVTSY
jgi:toxin-antitoxin system PIN domain toxin